MKYKVGAFNECPYNFDKKLCEILYIYGFYIKL